jgi:hypothetical protein
LDTVLTPEFAEDGAPATRREVPSLGEQQENAPWAESGGHRFDLVLGVLPVGGVNDRVGESMGDEIDSGIERDRFFEDDARPPVEMREEPIDQQDCVPGPGVATEDDHRRVAPQGPPGLI